MEHLDQLRDAFASAFPVAATPISLEFVACHPNNDHDVGFQMHLVFRDPGGNVRSIHESTISMLLPRKFGKREVERVRVFAIALSKLVPRIFETPIIEELGPIDLVDFTPLAYSSNKTEADFASAIATSRVGPFIPKQPGLAKLHAMFAEAFPAKSETASIEYVDIHPGKKPGLYNVTIRLVVWDVRDDGVMSIRDVKEQWVTLKLPVLDEVTFGRVREFLPAFVEVASKALKHPEIETLMPADLVDFSPLGLVKASTQADFITALSVPSRLGQYLIGGQMPA